MTTLQGCGCTCISVLFQVPLWYSCPAFWMNSGCVVTVDANLWAVMVWLLGDNALGLWASAIHG